VAVAADVVEGGEVMTMKLWTRAALIALLCSSAPAHAEPAAYDSPEAAIGALIAALEAKDKDALLGVFGPEFSDLVFTGDDEDDRATWREFYTSYRTYNRLEDRDGVVTLYIGRERWPFPAPLVMTGGKWRFDTEAARDEVEARRIGLNELDVIDTLRRAPIVQQEFRAVDHDGDGVMEFAAGILSSPGQRDGLYWPDEPGTPESPLGDFIARANADGYNFDGTDREPEPYLGYYFRILQKQGPAAPGGAYGYMINGNMVAGHAAMAFPAAYGETGIMTFMVGENGIVYEADLGEDTLAVAGAIDTFDPGEGWFEVED
jgi:hypothetical protein